VSSINSSPNLNRDLVEKLLERVKALPQYDHDVVDEVTAANLIAASSSPEQRAIANTALAQTVGVLLESVKADPVLNADADFVDLKAQLGAQIALFASPETLDLGLAGGASSAGLSPEEEQELADFEAKHPEIR
jgi:hypothetical protein